MILKEAITSVLRLQVNYSPANTADMKQRGVLVRTIIPSMLDGLWKSLASAAGIAEDDFLLEGRDGTGRKSDVPWVRFAAKSMSPRATAGWYVVLLFRRDGEGTYLALAHGSATFNGMAFVPRQSEHLKVLVDWAKSTLAKDLANRSDLLQEVRLGSNTPLALAYEESCPAACYYPRTALPSMESFTRDALTIAGLLGKIYKAELLGRMPLSMPPEIREMQRLTENMARPQSEAQSQGFALTSVARRAVELRAMRAAIDHLRTLGYLVKDVSAKQSFDLLATKEDQELKVEVKGTTSGLGSVLLTANEVELHKRYFPDNALIVVHSIELTHDGEKSSANGGMLKMWRPWNIDEKKLRGIAYSYALA